jgi:hypothetical protein
VIDTPLDPDEHEVPTQLGQRVPIIPFRFPFDLSERQTYAATTGLVCCSQVLSDESDDSRWLKALVVVSATVLWVALEYLCNPTPEYWFWALFDYAIVLVASVRHWYRRPLGWLWHWLHEVWLCVRNPRRGLHAPGGDRWPLAVLPKGFAKGLLALPTIEEDGVLHFTRGGGYGQVIKIQPRPNPDWLPMVKRRAIIGNRLKIFKKLRGDWSLYLQVREFDKHELEVASGPAWPWVRDTLAKHFIARHPYIMLRQDKVASVKSQAVALLKRFHDKRMEARLLGSQELERNQAELWDKAGLGWLTHWLIRVGIKRFVAGRRVFRSFLLRELPRVAHLAWLRPLTGESLFVDIAIHVKTRRPGPTRRSLQRRMRHWIAMDNDFEYQQAAADAARLIQRMRRNEDTEAEVGIYVTADEKQAEEVSEALETAQCEFSPTNFVHHRARVSTLLTGVDRVNRPMRLDLKTVVITDLLATGSYWPAGATLIGRALEAPEPVGINLFDTNANMNMAMFIAIIQGGGKTCTALTMAWRMANAHPEHPLAQSGLQIISVDYKPSRDYQTLFTNLAERGHNAKYNAWSAGALPAIEGHCGFNLADVPPEDRGQRVLELGRRLREAAAAQKFSGRPILLLIDEVIALAELEEGAAFMQEFGTQGRSENIAPVFMTQHPGPVLAHPKAAMAFANAGHIFLGRQNPAGLAAMRPLLDLDDETEMLLSDADEGSGLLRIERRDGSVMIGVHVQPEPWELFEFGSNPDERARRWRRDQEAAAQTEKRGGRRNGRQLVAV